MAANQNWKSRAESMLSQFIEGDSDDVRDPYYYSQNQNIMENSSSPAPPSSVTSCAGYDSVYDRLLGCGCHGSNEIGGAGTVVGGPCVSLFLQWVKLVLGGVIKGYLSSPLCLAFAPLLVGVGVGFWMGRRTNGSGTFISNNDGVTKQSIGIWGSFLGRFSQLYGWMSHYFMLAILHLDPRSKSIIASDLFQDERDDRTRTDLKTMESESKRESGVPPQCVPRHIAVIMDGNRRYGKAKYGNATRGHWDGSKTLIEFSKWCIAEGVQVCTVYAFSTENWDRDPAEVATLMAIFCKYCDELRVEAHRRGIRIHVLATEDERIPPDVKAGIDKMVSETKRNNNFTMNICLSYGGRGEIVNACKSIALDVQSGKIDVNRVSELDVQKKMLTGHCCDPDVIIRTSGEERLSNFLLWQVAYSEFFFLKKQWPELEKEDLLEVIRTFANGRKRRFGK